MLVSFILITLICVATLSLNYEDVVFDFSLYLLYGIVLALLCFTSIVLFIKSGKLAFFNLVMMCVCFIFSDVFFMINKFYFDLFVFSFLNVFSYVFSYYFMANFFIESDKNGDELLKE